MLASVEGTLAKLDRQTGQVVVVVQGLGLQLRVPMRTLAGLREGSQTKLHTSPIVSAEDIKIYGFAGELERDLFDICRGVKGVGGRTALAAIDHLTPAALIATVLDEDASKLATVPGIGPKTAERIVFELKSKRRQMQLLKAQEGGISGSQSAYVEEVLRSLGYDAQEIGSALANCHGNDDEELLRACLRRLSA